MCPLEANWVSAGFAAPGEGQEESQEAESRSNVERADPRGGTDRAKQMTAFEECHRWPLDSRGGGSFWEEKAGEWKAGKESTHLIGFVMQVISPGRAYET